MNIENFDFNYRSISNIHLECLIINKETKTRFGCIIQCQGIPPNEILFENFKNDRKLQKFFIDIDSEIIKENNVVEINKIN